LGILDEVLVKALSYMPTQQKEHWSQDQVPKLKSFSHAEMFPRISTKIWFTPSFLRKTLCVIYEQKASVFHN
jgi:hypothetical protein